MSFLFWTKLQQFCNSMDTRRIYHSFFPRQRKGPSSTKEHTHRPWTEGSPLPPTPPPRQCGGLQKRPYCPSPRLRGRGRFLTARAQRQSLRCLSREHP